MRGRVEDDGLHRDLQTGIGMIGITDPTIFIVIVVVPR